MTKSEVYSWRLTPEIKAALEQARLHAAAKTTFGIIRGGNAHRSEQARALIRERLERGRA